MEGKRAAAVNSSPVVFVHIKNAATFQSLGRASARERLGVRWSSAAFREEETVARTLFEIIRSKAAKDRRTPRSPGLWIHDSPITIHPLRPRAHFPF